MRAEKQRHSYYEARKFKFSINNCDIHSTVLNWISMVEPFLLTCAARLLQTEYSRDAAILADLCAMKTGPPRLFWYNCV